MERNHSILSREFYNFFKLSDEFDFSFRISKVIREIEAYLNAHSSYDFLDKEKYVFGIDVMYKLMRIFLVKKYPIADKASHDMMFMRALLNHKKIISVLAKYLYDERYIQSEDIIVDGQRLFKDMNIIYMLFMKWCITKQTQLQAKLYKRVKDLIIFEKSYLQRIYDELLSFFSNIEKLPYGEAEWLEDIDL